MKSYKNECEMEVPELDIITIAYDDEKTIKEKQAKYAQDMVKYIEARLPIEFELKKENIKTLRKLQIDKFIQNIIIGICQIKF